MTHIFPERIFITGGTGYIGSHTTLELLKAGYDVVIYDNLSNSSSSVIDRIEEISGKTVTFINGDIRDLGAISKAMKGCDAVIHFAGLKAIGESVEKPLEYEDNNVNGTEVLLTAMKQHKIFKIVFSSSATVYGEPQHLPIFEDHPLKPMNPYGENKVRVEQMLHEFYQVNTGSNITILRYFNPIGAHKSGLIGEDPRGIPNNLVPYIAQVAVGQQPRLTIFGDTYDTLDGTGVRDYIHVVDLAHAHVAALNGLTKSQYSVYNVGTGNGYSVLEVLRAYEKACGKPLSYSVHPKRKGDVASCYADVSKIKKELGWTAALTLSDMCEDSWRWQHQNPTGYE